MDRISNLPDEILCHIGSFLSAKEAVFAMLLSRRWKNLFVIVPQLCFRRLKDIEERLLALPVNSRIRKFSLEWWSYDIEPAHINHCLCQVLKLGVLVLELRRYVEVDEVYSLPLDVFTCKTITELTLGYGLGIDFLPTDAHLPSLKTLYLEFVRFSGFSRFAFNTLLSASPKLEELIMVDVEFERSKWSSTVSSPTLQRLTIRREEWENYDDSGFESISFDTPSLTYLSYHDYVPREYFVNLNCLVEAKLNLHVERHRDWAEEHADDFDPTNLINALKNVEILDLSLQTMKMIYVFRKVIPVFENLFRLSVGFSNNFWLSLPVLLKKSPNLKTLIITDCLDENFIYEEEVYGCPDVLSCPVESLKIMYYYGSIKELEQMKQFLEKLPCLELVEVHASVEDEERVKLLTDLLMLPRTSTKCKIQVTFS